MYLLQTISTILIDSLLNDVTTACLDKHLANFFITSHREYQIYVKTKAKLPPRTNQSLTRTAERFGRESLSNDTTTIVSDAAN